ncbi:hypothetical protein [Natrialba sp. SSL1]|uniref:hypothetical protein n=1 Tax=Natrialba sp. SSL1 TaxID=1869245 RepID=UPI0008F88878|nr:hypothetical protein [Natrialba sp. SSL1]OIB57896.1 hypothetical protein BBD46_10900 [Natrialba sp. SSL1]
MTIDPRDTTRRSLLTTTGSLGVLGLAGCLSDDDEEDEGGNGNDANGNGDDGGESENGADDSDHDDDHGHIDIETFELVDRDTDDVSAYVHDDHWDDGPLLVPVDGFVSVSAYVEDGHGDELALGDDEEYTLNARFADGAQEIVDIETHGDHLDISGEETGFTDLVFQIWHGDHADWESPALEVEVVEDIDDHEHDSDHDDGHEDDHDHDH